MRGKNKFSLYFVQEVCNQVPQILNLIHFYYLLSLILRAHTVEIYHPFAEIFVLHAAVHIFLLILRIKIFVFETCV